MIRAGIIGATGYTGIELLRLLNSHPSARIHTVTSRTEQGKTVAAVFPTLRGLTDLEYHGPETPLLKECNVIFFTTPNATAMYQAADLLDNGIKIIDLSADFRLRDAELWSKWYGEKHACPDLLKKAVYGLPELNRGLISGASLVANPGCYPTAVILALLPLLEAGLVDPTSLIADAKSGVSGAGRHAVVANLFCEVEESFKAYAASGHRHLPEIIQALNAIDGNVVDIIFIPHLVPMLRGIHATLYADIIKTGADIQAIYENRYRDEAFVDVMPGGSHPDTRSVRGTNVCRIAVHQPGQGHKLVVLSVIDNLVKGAAGQAVQNMNIMFGLEESTGLSAPALSP
ncbi:MAG: N-acetyl-gamma-glutamyl-phosphate reductase [Gammaproteobacteria bacterium RBG_16_51_14]|nr:MAG: N-acetyl-gamma-glutamyl-phosphate reductase [Gammaproteobacteria bacterium RBG_16_51_14]